MRCRRGARHACRRGRRRSHRSFLGAVRLAPRCCSVSLSSCRPQLDSFRRRARFGLIAAQAGITLDDSSWSAAASDAHSNIGQRLRHRAAAVDQPGRLHLAEVRRAGASATGSWSGSIRSSGARPLECRQRQGPLVDRLPGADGRPNPAWGNPRLFGASGPRHQQLKISNRHRRRRPCQRRS